MSETEPGKPMGGAFDGTSEPEVVTSTRTKTPTDKAKRREARAAAFRTMAGVGPERVRTGT